MKPYLSEMDLAKRWAISKHILQQWRNTKTGLPYLKIRNHISYPIEFIHEFESNHTTTLTGKFILPNFLKPKKENNNA